ncbi:hypothetical protein [Mesorhizobium sp. YM1C-6-2]|uniref:hypothetical protein n=1 Tax=Mesorhizobium sp. YM1C-6-2 TaxID=1827501 RepID=UPI0015FED6CC|nr:hypothetical protein [Mesorhizobium sp. YM1C-6-2]
MLAFMIIAGFGLAIFLVHRYDLYDGSWRSVSDRKIAAAYLGLFLSLACAGGALFFYAA